MEQAIALLLCKLLAERMQKMLSSVDLWSDQAELLCCYTFHFLPSTITYAYDQKDQQ